MTKNKIDVNNPKDVLQAATMHTLRVQKGLYKEGYEKGEAVLIETVGAMISLYLAAKDRWADDEVRAFTATRELLKDVSIMVEEVMRQFSSSEESGNLEHVAKEHGLSMDQVFENVDHVLDQSSGSLVDLRDSINLALKATD